jgi:hypothetical protein
VGSGRVVACGGVRISSDDFVGIVTQRALGWFSKAMPFPIRNSRRT